MSSEIRPLGRERRIAWKIAPGQGHRSDQLLLAPWADGDLEVDVADDQVAVLLREHRVVAILESGRHQLSVGSLRAGWSRPAGNDATADRCVEGSYSVTSLDRLLYLPQGILPQIPFELGEGGGVLRGEAALVIEDPERFYDAFLRYCEDLEEIPFVRICEAMLLDAITRWSRVRGGLPALAAETLADELRIAVGAVLSGVGLSAEQIVLREVAAEPMTVIAGMDAAQPRVPSY